jgi:phospholipid transport system substrate-binding protein
MIARRALLLFATIALWLPCAASAQGSPDRAAAFVRGIAERMVAVTDGGGTETDKRLAMQAVIDHDTDVDGIGQFCLGRFWRSATPEQQKAYLALFHQVMITSFSSRISDYRGVKVTMGKAVTRDDNDVVSTTVERPNNPPAHVDWVISSASGSPKIVDLVAEGTSMRLTQRSDYAAFLSQNGNSIEALLAAMKRQIAASS